MRRLAFTIRTRFPSGCAFASKLLLHDGIADEYLKSLRSGSRHWRFEPADVRNSPLNSGTAGWCSMQQTSRAPQIGAITCSLFNPRASNPAPLDVSAFPARQTSTSCRIFIAMYSTFCGVESLFVAHCVPHSICQISHPRFFALCVACRRFAHSTA